MTPAADPARWTDDEDDVRLGVPAAGPLRGLPRPPDPPSDTHLRDGETGLGRPEQVPAHQQALSAEDHQALRAEEDRTAAEELDRVNEMLASDPEVFRWLGWFASPLAFTFLLGAVGLSGLFLFNQVLSLLAALAVQSPWVQYLGYGAVGVLGGAVVLAMLRVLVLYVRLKRNQQVRLRVLGELSRRTRLRWLVKAKADEARARIEDYLRAYPIGTEKERQRLRALGLTDDRLLALEAVRGELLDPARYTSLDHWFDRFRGGFQSVLDDAAAGRIGYWSKRTGAVTAVSPNAFVDGAATLYHGFAMIGDLCRLYNLRAGRAGTAVLLGQVFFYSYLAGQLNDFESVAQDHLEGALSPLADLAAAGTVGGVVAKLGGKLGSKALAGALNYVLLRRLGKYACRLLRPVA